MCFMENPQDNAERLLLFCGGLEIIEEDLSKATGQDGDRARETRPLVPEAGNAHSLHSPSHQSPSTSGSAELSSDVLKIVITPEHQPS